METCNIYYDYALKCESTETDNKYHTHFATVKYQSWDVTIQWTSDGYLSLDLKSMQKYSAPVDFPFQPSKQQILNINHVHYEGTCIKNRDSVFCTLRRYLHTHPDDVPPEPGEGSQIL